MRTDTIGWTRTSQQAERVEPSEEAILAALREEWIYDVDGARPRYKDKKSLVINQLKSAYAIDFPAHQQAMQAVIAERDEARQALGDAAREIPMAGPVANRIRRLRTEHAQAMRELQVMADEKCRCFLERATTAEQALQAAQEEIARLKADNRELELTIAHTGRKFLIENEELAQRAQKLEARVRDLTCANRELRAINVSPNVTLGMIQDEKQQADRLQAEVDKLKDALDNEERKVWRIHPEQCDLSETWQEAFEVSRRDQETLRTCIADQRVELEKYKTSGMSGLITANQGLAQQLAEQRVEIERLQDSLNKFVVWHHEEGSPDIAVNQQWYDNQHAVIDGLREALLACVSELEGYAEFGSNKAAHIIDQARAALKENK